MTLVATDVIAVYIQKMRSFSFCTIKGASIIGNAEFEPFLKGTANAKVELFVKGALNFDSATFSLYINPV